MTYKPQGNILLAYLAGIIATLAEHFAAKIGYDLPPDIAAGLPMSIAIVLAHVCDIISSRNSQDDTKKVAAPNN